MPLVEVIYPEGSFDAATRKDLLSNLSSICLRWEGIEITDQSQSIAWVYLDERPAASIAAGGKELSESLYLVNVRVMAGFMDYERIEGMTAELTRAILDADGTDGTGEPRVFVIVEEVPSGTWAVDGKVWPSVFAADTLHLEAQRVTRMDEAIRSRPRLDVPLAERRSRLAGAVAPTEDGDGR
jgi:phenylpyruvate tautomerase PptA (4-oxalocrotonate tautomerase family)